MKKFWLRAALAAGLFCLIVTLFAALKDKPQPQALASVRVDNGPVISHIRATGNVSSVYDVRLSFASSGSVQAVPVAVGSLVTTGQELLRLDSKDAELQLKADELAVRESAADISHQARALKGLHADYEAGAVSRDQVVQAEERIVVSRIQMEKATVRAAQTRERLQQTSLYSPIAGVVTDVSVRPGEIATVGQPVITLSDKANQQILARMEQDDAQDLRIGMPVQVSLDGAPEQTHQEHILRIEPAVRKEGNTNYTAVWISLSPSGLQLRPNQQVDVRVPIGSDKSVMRLPLEALSTHNSKTAVWTLDKGSLRLSIIKTGMMGDRFVEVLSGLSQGQVILLAEGRALKEGDQARVATPVSAP